MQWSEVIDSLYFKNLPFKIELNRYGKIEMTAASNKHGRLQLHRRIAATQAKKRRSFLTECSVQTTEGVKVADVAWCSKAFIKQYGYQTPYSAAPEICIDIVSPSNSQQEMHDKVQLYLQAGAEEVSIVWEHGVVEYFSNTGTMAASNFGISIKLPLN
jgi:Uma2 family endonuclease